MVLDSIDTRVGCHCSPLLLPLLPVVELLHAGSLSTPVPHWAVLLAVVPALWLTIGATVVAVDRLLQRLDA